jgi:threonine/homoserine/homoserine lactone efflux protein
MATEKILCMTAMIVAGLLVLVFLLDAALGIPFGRSGPVFDILVILGGSFILWQGLETYKEFR